MQRMALFGCAGVTAVAVMAGSVRDAGSSLVGNNREKELAPGIELRLAEPQQVLWRTSYDLARKEAAEQQRPLFLLVHEPTYMWCAKLEQEIRNDPGVVWTLNHCFTPVKFSRKDEMALVRFLNIQFYPTLILADPDGKILHTTEGFCTARHLRETLDRTLDRLKGPAPKPPAP